MKGSEIRRAYLEYFRSKGHTVVQSSSLVPEKDPTILFANAGMNQFKECFLGTEMRSYTRAASAQKVVRISGKHNDLENVGHTARHHTFFEMMGNFSFGDYFKRDAILFAWDFATNVLQFSKDRLWVTVYEKDTEAAELWATLTDVRKDRILPHGAESNFWQMGETGPCGPCTEIFYYMGDDVANQSEAEFRKDDGTYLEFWNLVFMQFDKDAKGTLHPLPRPSIDTGMGLERVAAISQGVSSNYDSDLLRDLIAVCEDLSGFRYDGKRFAGPELCTDVRYAQDVAMRVVADHVRTATFLIGDGVSPGSDGRGYVLRRVIRRAVRHGRNLKIGMPFLAKIAEKVIALFGDVYPELRERADIIIRMIDAEERKFYETIDGGLAFLESERKKLKAGGMLSGETAFLLHDTYGFPLDLTEDVLRQHTLTVDTKAFERAMENQRRRSREDRQGRNLTFASIKIDSAPTEFRGYADDKIEARVTQVVLPEGEARKTLTEGDSVALLFDATPFYAESGGQVGDTGVIHFKDATLRVVDTQKLQGGTYSVHECEVVLGEIPTNIKGVSAQLEIDVVRRNRIRANHSVTHLVHAALRETLGSHVKQAGSRVDENSSRFDYSHFEPVTDTQLQQIQAVTNELIRANHAVETLVLPIEEARKTGAIALFGEKYGEKVRVVRIGSRSVEFCGGTHALRSGDIGCSFILHEGGIAAGVRRIESYAGVSAADALWKLRTEHNQIADLLKSDTSDLPLKVERALQRMKDLENEVQRLESKLAASASDDLLSSVRNSPGGVKVLTQALEGADAKTLRAMVDQLRNKLGSGVVALASRKGEETLLVAGVTPDLTSRFSAGSLVKEAIKISGGRGGGKADFAQAGGADPSKLEAALDHLFNLVT
jgi:alanyl-tRNA synthetase